MIAPADRFMNEKVSAARKRSAPTGWLPLPVMLQLLVGGSVFLRQHSAQRILQISKEIIPV